MATNAQILANTENAKLSTGPTTEAGKAKTSQNALRHGLASGRLMIHNESREEYHDLLQSLLDEYQPSGPTETLLVQDLAKHRWLADRAVLLQSIEFDTTKDYIPNTLPVLMRYQATNERAFHKTLKTLTELQLTRKQTESIGSVSQIKEITRRPASKPAGSPSLCVHPPLSVAEKVPTLSRTAPHPPQSAA